MRNINFITQNINSQPEQDIKLYQIAGQMMLSKLPDKFITTAIRAALEYEGIADLVFMWAEENDIKEKEEIIADIQELIDECINAENRKLTTIKLNDLETIAKDIRAFKDALLGKVIEKGGISKLSELTEIPQPSLSRFFNSNSMPQRITLIKIAKALKLDDVSILTPWSK